MHEVQIEMVANRFNHMTKFQHGSLPRFRNSAKRSSVLARYSVDDEMKELVGVEDRSSCLECVGCAGCRGSLRVHVEMLVGRGAGSHYVCDLRMLGGSEGCDRLLVFS